MKIGAHVSIEGGIFKAPLRAKKNGCECFQIFSRSPHGGSYIPLTPTEIKKFQANIQKTQLKEYYIHAPYFINLASSSNRIKYGSISALKKELERGSQIKAQYMMTHLGSAKDLGSKKAIQETIDSLKKVLECYKGSTQFLIEIAAGAGNIIGDNFQEIGEIIRKLAKKISQPIGVCFDTAHAFESGYDLRTQEAIDKTLKEFDKYIGLEKLKLIHGNDSLTDLNSHVDRHYHIGKGKIGLEAFKILVNHPKLKKLNLIIETPFKKPEDDFNNLKILKNLRKK